MYLALGETDDWAHDRRYDRVLETYARTDAYLKELWTWLQSDPEYRGQTHLLITTDHGRGHTAADWRDHGAKVEGAQDTWIAIATPSMTRRRSTPIRWPRRSPDGWASTGRRYGLAPVRRFAEDGPVTG
jgi:hypothetical protein